LSVVQRAAILSTIEVRNLSLLFCGRMFATARLLRIEGRDHQKRHHQTQAVFHAAGTMRTDKPAELRADEDDAHGGDKK
jgi:hypothetical protein